MSNDHRRATVLTGGGAGALDKIDGAGLAAGDVAQVVTTSGIYHYVNIQDSASENSPYVIRPDTNPGTNSWHLVIPKGPFSHVRAEHLTGQSIPNSTETIVVFESEEYDLLNEYNITTGIFTALYAGYYQVNATVDFATKTWVVDTSIDIFIYSGATRKKRHLTELQAACTTSYHLNIIDTIYLAASATISIKVNQDSGGAINLANYTDVSTIAIDRIA